MTTVRFVKCGDIITGYEIDGHAGYSDGDDIVCAAISSCTYMVANTITEIYKLDADIQVDEDGYFALILDSKDACNCQEILKGFNLHISALEQQYPSNIRSDVRHLN